MKIAFHSNSISFRGTEVALYDYAHYNEEILGNKSIIIIPERASEKVPDAVQKFEKRFGKILWYTDKSDMDRLLKENGVEIFYAIKQGINDGVLSKVAKNCIHSVFGELEPHGDVYAVISEWMSRAYSEGKIDFVPHIVQLPDVTLHFRDYLGIPPEAVVFGRYGGNDTFDLEFVHEVIKKIVSDFQDKYFIFMNTNDFLKGMSHPNIKFLAGSSDMKVKTAFINTCDAMLHARLRGETFGLAVGEFSLRNKPVITFARSPEQAHLWHLREKGIYYYDHYQLYHILASFKPMPIYDYNAFRYDFTPEVVMRKFNKVFIDGIPNQPL